MFFSSRVSTCTRLLQHQQHLLATKPTLQLRTAAGAATAVLRPFSTTKATMGKDSQISKSPPKHELVYFPGLASEVRAFGQFRKVLHTGLYSQVVTMEIPVGGDIGDEVHTVDQVLLFTSGEGKATVAGKDQVSSRLTYRYLKCLSTYLDIYIPYGQVLTYLPLTACRLSKHLMW